MSMCKCVKLTAIICILFCGFCAIAQAEDVQANCVAQVTLTSDKSYTNPFVEVKLDAIVTRPDGPELQVPMFWDGDDRWCLRYASGGKFKGSGIFLEGF